MREIRRRSIVVLLLVFLPPPLLLVLLLLVRCGVPWRRTGRRRPYPRAIAAAPPPPGDFRRGEARAPPRVPVATRARRRFPKPPLSIRPRSPRRPSRRLPLPRRCVASATPRASRRRRPNPSRRNRRRIGQSPRRPTPPRRAPTPPPPPRRRRNAHHHHHRPRARSARRPPSPPPPPSLVLPVSETSRAIRSPRPSPTRARRVPWRPRSRARPDRPAPLASGRETRGVQEQRRAGDGSVAFRDGVPRAFRARAHERRRRRRVGGKGQRRESRESTRGFRVEVRIRTRKVQSPREKNAVSVAPPRQSARRRRRRRRRRASATRSSSASASAASRPSAVAASVVAAGKSSRRCKVTVDARGRTSRRDAPRGTPPRTSRRSRARRRRRRPRPPTPPTRASTTPRTPPPTIRTIPKPREGATPTISAISAPSRARRDTPFARRRRRRRPTRRARRPSRPPTRPRFESTRTRTRTNRSRTVRVGRGMPFRASASRRCPSSADADAGAGDAAIARSIRTHDASPATESRPGREDDGASSTNDSESEMSESEMSDADAEFESESEMSESEMSESVRRRAFVPRRRRHLANGERGEVRAERGDDEFEPRIARRRVRGRRPRQRFGRREAPTRAKRERRPPSSPPPPPPRVFATIAAASGERSAPPPDEDARDAAMTRVAVASFASSFVGSAALAETASTNAAAQRGATPSRRHDPIGASFVNAPFVERVLEFFEDGGERASSLGGVFARRRERVERLVPRLRRRAR